MRGGPVDQNLSRSGVHFTACKGSSGGAAVEAAAVEHAGAMCRRHRRFKELSGAMARDFRRKHIFKGFQMTTKRKALEDRMAAEERLVASGVFSARNTSQDAEWAQMWARAVEEANRTGLPVRLRANEKPPKEAGPS